MKRWIQFGASLLSLGTLLGAVGSAQATDVAKLPLNATVLAKPNVIFGQDDSGSMDWEFMIASNDGIPIWDYANGVGVVSGDILRTGGTGRWGYYYLFPNGVGAGDRQYGDPNASYGYAMPPTPQLAWTRNKDFNTLYYNPQVTYEPWASAYVNGAVATFGNSPANAARSHPVNGASTYRLDADMNTTAAEWRFTFMAGMTIPAGATVHSCLGGPTPGALPFTVPTGHLSCLASMPFYPATYWMRVGDTGVPACVVDGVTCVWAPNGVDRLRRYEIKTGNVFPSGRSYAAEMQNFANWFTYYRKRRLMLGSAMGEVLENLSGVRLGVVNFNDLQAVTMYDADAPAASANRLRVAGEFYTPERRAGTPTRETLAYIGEQYRRTDNDAQGNKIVQYACQRNNAFVVTDGFARASAVSVPPYSRATYVSAAPYSTLFDGSLADLAAAYYTLNLRPDLAAGKVPPEDVSRQNADLNANIHMNTFGLTLGMTGIDWPANTTPFATPPTWANPDTQTRVQIDDLWHATITGRGKMYLATTPQQTALQLHAGLTEILAFDGSQGAASVSSVNLSKSDGMAYLAGYNPAGWAGDVTANALNGASGVVAATASWSAKSLLNARNWSSRVIATSNGSSSGGGQSFTVGTVGSLVNPGNAYGVTAHVMNYLRGDRSLEGGTFRIRTSLLGAVINSEPVVVDDGVLYVASGEGMLHAFETRNPDKGKELWAFVPYPALAGMGQISQRGYSFKARLDGAPVVAKVGAQKVLVAGMGTAGKAYYALDVSTPRGVSEGQLASSVMWQFPGAADTANQAKMGLAMGRPLVVHTSNNGTVVLVTSGYNTPDGKGRLWMLNASTGAVIKEFTTSTGSLANESGLTQVSPFGEADGSVRYVYGGDLLGNVWRFDLNAATGTAPFLMATLKGPSGDVQPVTSAPELLYLESRRVLVIGTGRLLDIGDFGNNQVQTLYAIADTASPTTLIDARASLKPQSYTRSTDTLVSNPIDWATDRGWYMDLSAGEQVTTRPLATYGVIGFSSNLNGANDCSASSYFYWLKVDATRLAPGVAVGSTLSSVANAARVVAVLTSDGVRYLTRTFDGNNRASPPLPGAAILPRKNAWREVRR